LNSIYQIGQLFLLNPEIQLNTLSNPYFENSTLSKDTNQKYLPFSTEDVLRLLRTG